MLYRNAGRALRPVHFMYVCLKYALRPCHCHRRSYPTQSLSGRQYRVTSSRYALYALYICLISLVSRLRTYNITIKWILEPKRSQKVLPNLRIFIYFSSVDFQILGSRLYHLVLCQILGCVVVRPYPNLFYPFRLTI